MTTVLELRCPVGPKALLMKIRQEGETPRIADGNLLELACRDCAKAKRQEDPSVRRVLHQFNLAGELVVSVVERD